MDCSDEMIRIPGGRYRVGSNCGRADEGPEHQVSIRAFEIDPFPVTVRRVVATLRRNELTLPKAWQRELRRPDVPATGMTASEAAAVARLMGKRLPTEVEWEVAAGRAFDRNGLVHRRPGAGPLPMMSVSECAALGLSTPEGLVAMVGLVWHWTSSPYDWHIGYARRHRFELKCQRALVVRGGIWSDYDGRSSFRSLRDPEKAYERVGFRCVRDLDI